MVNPSTSSQGLSRISHQQISVVLRVFLVVQRYQATSKAGGILIPGNNIYPLKLFVVACLSAPTIDTADSVGSEQRLKAL